MKKTFLLNILFLLLINVNAATHTVNSGNFYYTPSMLNINVNDTVVWINDGGYHNVNFNINTITNQSFNNPVSFSSNPTSSATLHTYVFSVPGTYMYDCSVGSHAAAGMVGTINVQSFTPNALTFTSIMDLTVPSSTYSHSCSSCNGKAIMLTANQSISDLSIYGIGSATNGGGTDGQEYTFPSISLNAGQHIILARDSAALSTYFDGCLEQFSGAMHPTIIIESQSGEPKGNGNDAYELFENNVVVETFGDITHSYGTSYASIPWGYRDSWAWKDTALSNVGNWIYGGDNCSDGSTTTQTSNCPFPLATSSCVSTVSDITFKVDMSQYAGSQGAGYTVNLNGTFNNWCGGCNPMTDADGDSIWEITLPLNIGDSIRYKFTVNGWNDQENFISGAPCTNTNSNGNTDRFLVIPSSNTDLGVVCFNSCSVCVSQVVYNITLKVNTANITVGPNGMYAGGGVLASQLGNGAQALQLTDADGDGTYEGIASLSGPSTGFQGHYVFLNSPSNSGDYNAKEQLGGLSCGDPNNWNDRLLPIITSDTTLLHCFGSCETDGTCGAPPTFPYYTFQLDMNQSGYDSTATPYLRGSWDWGGPGDMMSDADGDGVWQVIRQVIGGAEYLFAVDTTGSGGWDVNESNDPNEPCTNGNAQYTNRVLTIASSDTTLGIVCFESCFSCSSSSGGFTSDLLFSEYAEGTSNNKYLEIYNGTGMPVDLSNYSLSSCSNGCNNAGEFDYPDNVTFSSGTILNHGDVFVVANPNADPLILSSADQTFTYLSNGDDFFALTLAGATASNYTIIDVIGQMGPDPGQGWDVAGVTNGTKEHTLVRKSNVCQPDTSWSNSAGTDSINSQWIVLAQNDWTHLDTHSTNCSSQPPPPPTSSVTITYSVDVSDYLIGGATLDSLGIRIAGNFADNGGKVGGLPMSNWSPTDAQSAMSDPDGDSIWTITISYDSINPNSVQYYKFVNGNWGAGMEESVNDTLCGGAGGFGSDRFFNIPPMDTSICYIWNSCTSCGNIINYIDVTFTLNVSSIIQLGGSIDPTGMFIAGGGTFGNPGDNLMTDLGNDLWSITFSKPVGFSSDYTFTNGNSGWGAKENISGLSCAVPPFDDRNLAPVYSDTTIQHCFGTCDYDGTCNSVVIPGGSGLILKAITAIDLPSNAGKAVHITAEQAISDLSIYGIGTANNGGGTDGEEFTFPNVSVNAGEHIIVCRDSVELSNYLSDDCFSNFSLVYVDASVNQNGNDAIELFMNDSVVETFGDADVNGTGEPWEYTDSWAYKDSSGNWTYGGIGCTSGFSTSDSSSCPYPFCDYSSNPTGLANILNDIRIYPNPAKDVINISSTEIINHIQILDLVGRELLYIEASEKSIALDASSLNNNVYLLVYTIGGSHTATKKIVINK